MLAFLTIASFWTSTVLSELFGTQATITAVKTAIPWGVLLLTPAMIATGASGQARARGRATPLIVAKRKRLIAAALSGVLVLIPSAVFLAARARAGDFGLAFMAVQALELVAGAINLTLLGLSMRDGFRLTGRFRRRAI